MNKYSKSINETDYSIPRIFKSYFWMMSDHKYGYIQDEFTGDSVFFHKSCLHVELKEPEIMANKYRIFWNYYVYKLGVSPINGRICCRTISELDDVLVKEFVENYDKYEDAYKKFIDSYIRPYYNYLSSYPLENIKFRVKETVDILNNHLQNILNGSLYTCFEVMFCQGQVWDKDPDERYYYNMYSGLIDSESANGDIESIVGMKNHMDRYITHLIHSKKAEYRGLCKSKEEISSRISEYYEKWRAELLNEYDISKHIDSLIEEALEAEKWKQTAISGICSFVSNRYYKQYLNSFKEELVKHKDYLASAASPFSNCIVYNGLVYWINSDNKSVTLQSTAGALGKCTHYLKPEKDIRFEEIIVPEKVFGNNSVYPVTAIARGVFDSMSELRSIYIPQYVTSIKWSFWECEKLEKIVVDPNNEHFFDIDGVLFSYDKKALLAFPQNKGSDYVVPNGIERIHNMAFKNNRTIRKITIPDTLSTIGINAFYRCENLEEIHGRYCHDISFEGFYGDIGRVNPKVVFDYGNKNVNLRLSSLMLPYKEHDFEVYP